MQYGRAFSFLSAPIRAFAAAGGTCLIGLWHLWDFSWLYLPYVSITRYAEEVLNRYSCQRQDGASMTAEMNGLALWSAPVHGLILSAVSCHTCKGLMSHSGRRSSERSPSQILQVA
jgi:hypothetical protein